MVMATPFLHALRESAEGEIWGVGKSMGMHLYNGLNYFDRFIPQDDKNPIGFLDRVSAIKSVRFDRAIVLPHSFRSALLFFLSQVPERIGYARNKRSLLLTRRLEETVAQPEPTVQHYLRMLDGLGMRRCIESPVLKVTEDEEQKFDSRFMDVGGDFVVFIVGAQYGPSKRWPDACFSELADMIIERLGLPIYILPGKEEEGIARRVRDGVQNSEMVQIKSMGVRDLKVCLSRASLVVSNDTGPRHISAALSVPTIIILGPMDDRYTRYPNDFAYTMSRDVPCRPCNKKKCDRNHECLRGIAPGDVFRRVEEVLRERLARAD
jgi:heptosyltransferase II